MGYSTRQIARQLNRHHSTIARELKRNTQEKYEAELADELAGKRRLVCHRKELKSEQLIQTIQKYLELTWSPEQISNTVLKGVLSFKTIYRWIYDVTILLGDLRCLRQKGKRRKLRETRGRFNTGTSIHQRSKDVKKRETFGHWELDTVVSSRGKSKGCLATYMNSFLKTPLKPILLIEEKSLLVILKLKVPVYFADAYSSWQRGSNRKCQWSSSRVFPEEDRLSTSQ